MSKEKWYIYIEDNFYIIKSFERKYFNGKKKTKEILWLSKRNSSKS